MFPYEQLVITCQSDPEIPAPFAHYYLLSVTANPSALTLSFRQEYTGREELTEDEILEEGFGMNDDFAWEGSLNKVWKQQLDELLKNSRFLPVAPETNHDFMVEVKTISKAGEEIACVAEKDIQKWIYLVQEIKQAIYETNEIERPLLIEYLHIGKEKTTGVTLTGYFADRTFSVQVDGRPRELFDWRNLQELIRMIFLKCETDSEEGISRTPVKEGRYLLLPEADWYRFGQGIKELEKGSQVLEKLAILLDKLAGIQVPSK